MKAISLWQPWASLIACKAKLVETRSWQTAYRGPLAIHAAKRPMDEDGLALLASLPGFVLSLLFNGRKVDLAPGCLPLGAVVATATLRACGYMGINAAEVERFMERHKLDDLEVAAGHYGPGRYGWFFSGVQRLEPPCVTAGHQGLWVWDEAEHTQQPRLV